MTRVAPTVFAGGSRPSGAAGRGAFTARYDNASSNPENARTWLGADYLSAKSANSFGVRRTLRMRSRHEVSNNPFLFGITHSNADDLIDSGPTLQLYTPDAKFNRLVERAWAEWCAEVDLVEKLRAAKLAKTVDGEGFLVLKTVEDLEQPVKLYPCDLEADQVTTPAPANLTELWVDGLDLHPLTGRPTAYHVLKGHPGDFFFPGLNPLAVDKIPARWVIHWFQRSRPGQVRGVPVFTPSLDLFGELRAFRKAVLTNAQIAASLTGVLESEAPAQQDDDGEAEAFKRVPLDRGMMTTLPPGFKLNGFDPKQPQTTYEMFQEKCLGEACRPLNYPLNLALGTSQKFNFSSSKLDHINYRNGLTVERGQCGRAVLEPLFRAWFEEAVLCGTVPVWEGGIAPPPHEWHWPGFESIDPAADATADQTTLAGGQQTWREFWAKRGRDWKDVMAQQKAEHDELERLGITFGEPLKQTVTDTDGDLEPGDDGRPAKPKAKAEARGRAKVRATKDDNGQEHDEDGRFGEGGGGGGKKGDGGGGKPTRQAARAERREAEDRELADAREREDKEIGKDREAEDEEAREGMSDEEYAEYLAEKQEERDAEDEEREGDRDQEDSDREDERAEEDEGDESEHRDRWEGEDDDRDAAREGEREADREAHEAEREKARDRDADAVEKGRDKEDKATKKARQKEDKAAEKDREAEDEDGDPAFGRDLADDRIAAARDKADDKLYDARCDEDADVEEAREKADAKTEKARDREDERLAAKREKEDAKLAERRAKEDATDGPPDADRVELREDEDAEREAARDDEDEAAEAARGKEDEAAEAARAKEDADREAARTAEDGETEEARKAEDAERAERRAKEDAAWEAAEPEREKARDKEDDEREARRKGEDREREARRKGEDSDRDEAHDAETERQWEEKERARAGRHAAEDRDTYHRRKGEHAGAHAGHYDADAHGRHGGDAKAARGRRREVAGV